MRAGFALLEVLVALLTLEVAVVGVLGSLVVARDTMRQAETLERATARAEGVLDSLRLRDGPGEGVRAFGGGEIRWVVDDQGGLLLTAVSDRGGPLFDVRSRVSTP
jgi:type II secretory pathway pseudopilin PulG